MATDLIDFTNCEKTKKNYEGANGSKICIKYNGELYMLKFPPAANRNKDLSYTNGTVSEYLGCHILESLGFETQETILGTYNKNGKEKIVVACKDFTENNRYTVQPFSSLKNTIIDSGHNGTGTELSEVLDAIDRQDSYEPGYLKNYFWDLFIGDALIGNWDRHNGNWASLYDSNTDTVKLAPVYDCGSSMYPSADIEIMKSVISDREQLLFRVYEIPTSALKLNGNKINYFKFISSLENDDCNAALKRIYPRIDIKKINKIIDETPLISDIQKNFFKTIVNARRELILEYSYNKLLKREQSIGLSETQDKLNCESFGKEYLNKVFEFINQMTIKEAAKKAHDELVNINPYEKIVRQNMLNKYLNSLGIKNNNDFAEYVKNNRQKSVEKKSVQKSRNKDVFSGIGY